jgi:hypothetical protein
MGCVGNGVPATTTTAPKLGLHFQLPSHPTVSPHQRFRDTVEQAVVGEALGFESVWPVEQHFDGDRCDRPFAVVAWLATWRASRGVYWCRWMTDCVPSPR